MKLLNDSPLKHSDYPAVVKTVTEEGEFACLHSERFQAALKAFSSTSVLSNTVILTCFVICF